MRVDAHLHLWDLATGDYAWNTPELGPGHATFGPADASAALASAEVDAAVLVQAADTAGDTERMFAVARTRPWVVGVVGWLPLAEPDRSAGLLDRWVREPTFCGVRQLLHDHPDPELLDAATVRRTLCRLADQGIPLDVPDAWPRLWPALRRLVTDLPELTVVVDHLGKPAPGSADPSARTAWADDLRALAVHPQVVAKLSGLGAFFPAETPVGPAAVTDFVDVALEAFGPDRLMIGSDWPLSLAGGTYASVHAAVAATLTELSPDERADLDGGTAVRVYGLSPGTGAASSPRR